MLRTRACVHAGACSPQPCTWASGCSGGGARQAVSWDHGRRVTSARPSASPGDTWFSDGLSFPSCLSETPASGLRGLPRLPAARGTVALPSGTRVSEPCWSWGLQCLLGPSAAHVGLTEAPGEEAGAHSHFSRSPSTNKTKTKKITSKMMKTVEVVPRRRHSSSHNRSQLAQTLPSQH